jgi:eukaryotic-like serine/threonine-protein kinase
VAREKVCVMKVELKVISGPHEGQTFLFDGHDTFLVGRGPQAHFRLPKRDNFFSRLHFMIEVNPPFCRLTDLESTNGTMINQERVQSADLRNGDVIRGGKTHISVCIDEDDIRETRRQVISPSDDEADTVEVKTVPEAVPQNAETPSTDIFIGPYEIKRELGRGGMGVVYLARRTDDPNPIALKTIRPDVEASERDIKLFLREAQVLQSLQHPRIIPFVEIGEDNGQLYFAMEYLPAPNAAELLRERGSLPVSTAVAIACQVLEALEYAHERRYVHRDIKPENVLVQDTGTSINVKLADFGLARVYQTSRMSGITMQGEIGGSLAFAPPEHLTNYRDAAPTGDLYSVAAMLYTLLTGEFIYNFPDSVAKAVLMVLQTDPIPIGERRDDLPQDLIMVLHKALERDSKQRFASASEMRTALINWT